MPQLPIDPKKIAMVMELLGQSDDATSPGRSGGGGGGASFGDASANDGDASARNAILLDGRMPADAPRSVDQGPVYEPSHTPDPGTPLDANRLPEVNTRRMGQNADPSGLLPSRTLSPLDTNRLPQMNLGQWGSAAPGNLPADRSSTGAAHPPLPSGVDALATFLGGAQKPTAGPLDSSQLLELGDNRKKLKDEYEQRRGNAIGANDGREVARVSQFLNELNGDIDNDPFTGKAAYAKSQADAAAYHAESQLNTPDSPEAQAQGRRDAVALQKSMVEHPNPNVSPFAGGDSIPNVPGAVPTTGAGRSATPGGGSLGAAPQMPQGGDFESRFRQGTADLRPEDAANVRALLEYRANIPSGNVLSRPEWSTIVGRARMIDPTFDITAFDARKKLRDSLQGGGELNQRIRSLNALAGHVTDLDTSRQALGNFNVGAFANPAINWMERQVGGNGKFAHFDTTNGLVNTEMGKFLGGANATNELRNSVGAGINSDSSDDAIAQHIQAISGLSREQYNAILSSAGGVAYLENLIKQQILPQTSSFLDRSSGRSATPKQKVGIASMRETH